VYLKTCISQNLFSILKRCPDRNILLSHIVISFVSGFETPRGLQDLMPTTTPGHRTPEPAVKKNAAEAAFAKRFRSQFTLKMASPELLDF
jgi:hypothetical protein